VIAGAFLRKELAELGRDRRILLLSIVIPVLVNPAMFALTSALERKEETKLSERVLSVAITGGEDASAIREAALADSTLHVVEDAPGEDLRESVRGGEIEAALDVRNGEAVLVAHGPRPASAEAATRLRRAIAEAERRERERHWRNAGGAGELDDGREIREVDVATQEESSGAGAGRRVPLLLVMTLFIAGSALSSDVVAGEKERGTLETLYLTPARRRDIALAKYAVVFGATLLAGLLNVVSMVVAAKLGWIGDFSGAGGPSSSLGSTFSIEGVLTTCVLVIPLAALVGGVLLGLSAYARSIKEYQVLATPIMLVALLPGLLAMSQVVPLNPWTALIPVANVALAVRDGMLGPLPFPIFVIVSIASVGWGLLAMRWVEGVLSREEAILGFDPEPLLAKTESGRRRAVMLGMAVTVIVYFYLGQLLQAWDLRKGLLLSLWALLPALAAFTLKIAWSGGAVREVLSLRGARPAAILGAALLGFGSVVPMLHGVMRVQNLFLPTPEGLMKPLEDSISQTSTLATLFLIAASPAICEEIAFRGVFLGLLRRVVPLSRALLISSAFFGLLHLSIFRFFPTTLLGLVMGGLVVRTGSILTSMAFHFAYNGCAVLGERAFLESWRTGSLAAWGVSLAALAAGGVLVFRGSRS
jgi:sodium transport system permease protein